jgi:hypothetical protein
MSNKKRDWQIYHNMNLAVMFGSYQNQDGTSLHSQYKLTMCLDRIGSHMCAQRRVRAGVCPCEHHVFAMQTQNDPTIVEVKSGTRKSNIVKCGAISSDDGKYTIPATTLAGRPQVLGLPFTLKDLLPMVAPGNHVILYGAILSPFARSLGPLDLHHHSEPRVLFAFEPDSSRLVYSFSALHAPPTHSAVLNPIMHRDAIDAYATCGSAALRVWSAEC